MNENKDAGYRVRGLRHERCGVPAEVLDLAQLDVPAPGPGEALVALRVAAIHYSDLGMINGTYGRARTLPAIAGREGVGEVVAVGADTVGLRIGDLVRMPENAGAWREAVVAKADEFFPIPPGVPVEQAAQAFINPPTAWRLLYDFVPLQPGDWLIQNAGTSAVGIVVAQLARHFGWRVVSVVRDVAATARLQVAGAAAVVAEDSGYEKDPGALTGGAPLKLALNGIGGESAGRLCRAVAPGGVVVTYGGITSDPMRFPTRYLIFNDIVLRGFWMDLWARTHSREQLEVFWRQMLELLQAGVIEQPVATRYPLAEWRTAIELAFRGGRAGKVLFTSAWRP
ncbi:MAG: 2-enoyl thioester reductase domain-containing protein [Opitutales bacterium]